MNSNDFWRVFVKSGSVCDYLVYIENEKGVCGDGKLENDGACNNAKKLPRK